MAAAGLSPAGDGLGCELTSVGLQPADVSTISWSKFATVVLRAAAATGDNRTFTVIGVSWRLGQRLDAITSRWPRWSPTNVFFCYFMSVSGRSLKVIPWLQNLGSRCHE